MLIQSSIGKKILMALTGQIMILFVIVHLLGNSTIYFDWLNAYAEHLHALPALVWLFRLVMIVVLTLHILFGILLALENRSARSQSYAVKNTLKTNFAAKNMIWTGVLIGAFLVYHLLHFTVQMINPELSASLNNDALGRPDVFNMVVRNFQNVAIVSLYVFALAALLLHLYHGIQSSFQTLGLNNDRTLPFITRLGSVAAIVLFIGYIAVPVIIVLGLVGR